MPTPGLPQRGPATPSEWLLSAILAAIVFGCFLAVVLVDYEPHKLIALLFPLFWMLLLPWHEAGHAVVAWLAGWYVRKVVIGWGRPLKRLRWGRATIEIRAVPLEGFVQSRPTSMDFPRLKNALIYFAGPGAELLLLGVLLAVIGPRTLITPANSYLLIIAQSLALAIVVSAFINLVPHSVTSATGEVLANDGLGIIQSFLVPESHFAAMIGASYADEDDTYDTADR